MLDRLEQALATSLVPARTERPMSRMEAFGLSMARRRRSKPATAAA